MLNRLYLCICEIDYNLFLIKHVRVFYIFQINGKLVVCTYVTLNSMKSALLE